MGREAVSLGGWAGEDRGWAQGDNREVGIGAFRFGIYIYFLFIYVF